MGISRHLMPVDVPRSVSVCRAEINVVVHAGSNGVLRCNMSESKSITLQDFCCGLEVTVQAVYFSKEIE